MLDSKYEDAMMGDADNPMYTAPPMANPVAVFDLKTQLVIFEDDESPNQMAPPPCAVGGYTRPFAVFALKVHPCRVMVEPRVVNTAPPKEAVLSLKTQEMKEGVELCTYTTAPDPPTAL